MCVDIPKLKRFVKLHLHVFNCIAVRACRLVRIQAIPCVAGVCFQESVSRATWAHSSQWCHCDVSSRIVSIGLSFPHDLCCIVLSRAVSRCACTVLPVCDRIAWDVFIFCVEFQVSALKKHRRINTIPMFSSINY